MRYLLTVIVVLALAAPAMSQCTTTLKQATADFDYYPYLPATSDPFTPADCSSCDWQMTFDITEQGEATTIRAKVDCLRVSEPIVSTTYDSPSTGNTVGEKNKTITDSSEGHLHIEYVSGPTGDFENMVLEAKNFE